MSTPIETNTEELQEVLQQVYNLPNRSGGSTTPDLVISFVANEGDSYLTPDSVVASNFSIKSGSVQSTYTKLMNREEVKVILEHEYWYGNSKYTGVFHPIMVCAEEYSTQNTQSVCLEFAVNLVPGYGYTRFMGLIFNLDGTISHTSLKTV